MCGAYLNLSTVPSISAMFQTDAIWMKFPVHLVNKGLVPISYKYFVRNLALHHFLLSPVAWNNWVSINLTSYTLIKLAGRAVMQTLYNNQEYSRRLENILLHQKHDQVYATVPVRHLQAWMLHASGIILYTLQIVCYFNLKILFNK